MAFELQRADLPPFKSPLIEPLRSFPFEWRLNLIARQIHRYRDRLDLGANVSQITSDLLAHMSPGWEDTGDRNVVAGAARPGGQRSTDDSRIGRNEPCPCGSGKRYKHCHGRLDIG
jgi:preprotein translocase subunit SecA